MRFLLVELTEGTEEDYKDVHLAVIYDLGFAPMVWGTDAQDKPEAWKLPKGMLFLESEMDDEELNHMVMSTIKGIWRGGFKSLIIPANGWNGDDFPSPKNSVNSTNMDHIEVTRQD